MQLIGQITQSILRLSAFLLSLMIDLVMLGYGKNTVKDRKVAGFAVLFLLTSLICLMS